MMLNAKNDHPLHQCSFVFPCFFPSLPQKMFGIFLLHKQTNQMNQPNRAGLKSLRPALHPQVKGTKFTRLKGHSTIHEMVGQWTCKQKGPEIQEEECISIIFQESLVFRNLCHVGSSKAQWQTNWRPQIIDLLRGSTKNKSRWKIIPHDNRILCFMGWTRSKWLKI